MPLLGGIFGRKSKSSARNDHGVSHAPGSTASSDIDSILSTSTTSFVTTEKSLPSSPNGKNVLSSTSGSSQLYPSIAGKHSASSGRLRLPFSRKKQKAPPANANSTFSISPSSIQPPRLPYPTRLSINAASDTDVTDTWRLHPPPSKSAVFAAYVDSNNALSSHSLPNEPMQSWSSPSTPIPKERGKRPSPFSWTKSSSSGISKSPAPEPSKPPKLTSLDSSLCLDSDSFNLKSFRHIRSSSPSASTSSLVAPSARPRVTSINSDSSQRISVAAFREAQARRSTADSPVPSFRSPSPSFPQPRFPQDGRRGRTSIRPSPAANELPSSSQSKAGIHHQKRRSTSLAVGYTSESEESTTASEEDSDDGTDGYGNVRIHRNRTITARKGPLVGRQAKSDIGHGSASYGPATPSSHPPPGSLATRSQSGHEQVGENVRQISFAANFRHETQSPRSNSSLDVYGDAVRPGAGASTSALSPSAATKRTSILVNANVGLNQGSSHSESSDGFVYRLMVQIPQSKSLSKLRSIFDILQHILILLFQNLNQSVLTPIRRNRTQIPTMLLLRRSYHHVDLGVPFLKSQIPVHEPEDLQHEAQPNLSSISMSSATRVPQLALKELMMMDLLRADY